MGKVALHGVAGGRYVVWGVRLVEDTPNVVGHGVGANEELVANLRVAFARGHEKSN